MNNSLYGINYKNIIFYSFNGNSKIKKKSGSLRALQIQFI